MNANRTRLSFSLVGSLLINYALLLPGMLLLGAGSNGPDSTDASYESLIEVDATSKDLQLGIKDANVSTLTWIGYDEYLEHVARRAEFEQAQMRASQGELATGNPTPAPSAPDARPVSVPTRVPTPRFTQEPALKSPEQPDTPPQLTTLPEAPTSNPAAEQTPEAPQTATPTLGLKRPSLTEVLVGTTPDAQGEHVQAKALAEPVPTTDSPAIAVAEPFSSSNGLEDAPLHLNGNDRDSDATSILKVTERQMNLGQPLAREGLTLYPRRPRFTSLRVISSGGKRGVTARLIFNEHSKKRTTAAGVVQFLPAKAYIGRVVTFGQDAGTVRWFNQVNLMGPLEQTIHSSLFSWAAIGPQVDAMTPEEPVIINLDLQVAVR